MSPSRFITSCQALACSVSSNPGGKGQLQSNPKSQKGSGQSGFRSQRDQVKRKGEEVDR